MKRIFYLMIILITQSSFAAPAGFYTGIEAGRAYTHYRPTDVSGVTTAQIDNIGFGGRIYAGYQWDANWAAEIGYTYYPLTHFNNINQTGFNGRINETASDLMGKFIIPFSCKLNGYGKLGFAHINAGKEANLPGGNKSEFCPTYGLGLSYDITTNVPIDISWRRVQQIGSIADADLLAIGISYHFG